MGKALMLGGITTSVASGSELNLFGAASNATESITQASATEDCAFTGLRFRIGSGGSGTNTLQFRDGGANGANVASRAGAGDAEDTTNTDTLSAGDLFNLAHTDTGSNPAFSWVAANVAMASGHGCYHFSGQFVGVVCDVASSTRFLPINGLLSADANATEANQQFEVREYTSLEAFQVRVSANARANDSVFRVRVNGSSVGTAITYGAGASGLQSVTGMGISLSPGDLVCISLTLGTGVEDLTLVFVGVTMKSTDNASAAGCTTQNGLAIAATATPAYFPPGGSVTAGSAGTGRRAKPGFATRCQNLRCFLSANTYSADATLKLFVNDAAQITLTIPAGVTGWHRNTTDHFDIDADDEISFEVVGGTSGSISIHNMWVSLAEIPASAQPPRTMHQARMRRAA